MKAIVLLSEPRELYYWLVAILSGPHKHKNVHQMHFWPLHQCRDAPNYFLVWIESPQSPKVADWGISNPVPQIWLLRPMSFWAGPWEHREQEPRRRSIDDSHCWDSLQGSQASSAWIGQSRLITARGPTFARKQFARTLAALVFSEPCAYTNEPGQENPCVRIQRLACRSGPLNWLDSESDSSASTSLSRPVKKGSS